MSACSLQIHVELSTPKHFGLFQPACIDFYNGLLHFLYLKFSIAVLAYTVTYNKGLFQAHFNENTRNRIEQDKLGYRFVHLQ